MNSERSSSTALSRRWTQLCRSQQLARRAAMKRQNQNYMAMLREKIPDGEGENRQETFFARDLFCRAINQRKIHQKPIFPPILFF